MTLSALALALCCTFQEAKGKSFDVFGPDREAARRRSEEADRVAARFREWFGKSPPRGSILLGEGDRKDPRLLAGGSTWTWKWEGPEEAFLHELAHLLLVMTHGKKEGQYGSALPDWIDEGFACQFDPGSLRRLYDRTLATALREDTWLRFQDLQDIVHPDTRDPAARKPSDRALWYAETAAVFAFVASEHGPEALHSLADRKKGLPDLEADWMSWISVLARLRLPPEDEIGRWARRGPEYEKALEQVLDFRRWAAAFREVRDKLGRAEPDLEIEVVLDSWEGTHPSAAAREKDRGVVRFNMPRLGDLQKKADDLEARAQSLPAGQKAVWKVPPLRLPRLVPHEITHLFQGRDPSPLWLHEGLASWIGGDEHYLRAFAHQGKRVAAVDEPIEAHDDAYARGMLFFRWMERKAGKEGIRAFAAAGAVDWKKELEKVAGLGWDRIREEERDWSADYLRRITSE